MIVKQYIKKEYLLFVNQIVDSVSNYSQYNFQTNSNVNNYKKKGLLYYQYLKSIIELFILLIKVNDSSISLFYIHTSFLFKEKGKYFDNFFNHIKTNKKYLYVSYSKFEYVDKIDTIKVYNIGLIVNLLSKSKLFKKQTKLNNFNEWVFANELITKRLKSNQIFIPTFSNEPGLALCLNKYRDNYFLIEKQHGNVINYPPYMINTDLRLIDQFYYKNIESKCFLENKIFKNKQVIFEEISSKEVEFLDDSTKMEILYISSYEFDDFHPVFKSFLMNQTIDLLVRFRLHPRQKNLEPKFIKFLQEYKISYQIQNNKNWYDSLPKNIIVISPLSSVIEEATEFGLKTIIIDKLGHNRFKHLLTQNNCSYSEDLLTYFSSI